MPFPLILCVYALLFIVFPNYVKETTLSKRKRLSYGGLTIFCSRYNLLFCGSSEYVNSSAVQLVISRIES